MKGNKKANEKTADDTLTFMDEFALLDDELTEVSYNKPKRDRRTNTGTKSKSRIVEADASLSKTEKTLIAVGIAVAVVCVAVGTILLQARAVGNALRSFAEVGNTATDLSMIGVDGITAVEQAAYASMLAASKETVEQEEAFDGEIIEIEMIAQTVKGDLKIKFLDKENSRVVEGIPFAAQVTDPNGNEEKYTDDDKNGIIYLEEIEPGEYQVKELPIEGKEYRQYSVKHVTHHVKVSDVLAYTEIDVSDEIKDKSEVDVAAEDNMADNDTPEEGHLEDTATLIASSKTQISGGTGYVAIDKSEIADPYNTARADFLNGSGFRYMDEDTTGETNGAGNGAGNDAQTATTGGDDSATDGSSAENDGNTVPSGTADTGDSGADNGASAATDDGSAGAANTDDSTPAPAASVTVSAVSVTAGKEIDLKQTGLTSSNSAVAAVNGSSVKGVSEGTARITSADGTMIWDVTVTPAEPVVNDNADLKDKQGRQVYVKNGEEYRRAVNSDYRTYNEFFVMVNNGEEVFRYTGWQTVDGKTRYYDQNGNMLTGAQVIGGVKYTFDDTGALISGTTTLGIDVSEYNGAIDWSQVKNSGVSYAIIRLGYRGWGSGVLVEDARFRQNIQGAAANGIRVGVYFVTQAVNEVEAVEEASMVLGIIRNYAISYPVFLDVETSGGRGAGRADGLSVGTRTAVCNAFCRTVANGGYRAGVYANKNWLENHIDTPQIAGYNIWMAQYYTEPTYRRTKFDMWQYTSSGSVAGIGGRVDMNISYTAY